MLLMILISILISQIAGDYNLQVNSKYKCPKHWVKFEESCYRFVGTPPKTYESARQTCLIYQGDLLSINSVEEYQFLFYQLFFNDRQHRNWWIGVKRRGHWTNEDGSQVPNLQAAFLPEPSDDIIRDHLSFGFSNELRRWGLNRTTPDEQFLYICEAPVSVLKNLIDDERDFDYGLLVVNPEEIPRGPRFVKQPEDKIFDIFARDHVNEVSLRCEADGYPNPTYAWFKEEYIDGILNAILIDPFLNSKYTISGGNLMIQDPQEHLDYGKYFCLAENEFGRIRSDSVTLKFSRILEFPLVKDTERGELKRGKAMFCDAPRQYLDVFYFWVRSSLLDRVEENQRVFVSQDGTLYFSTLDHSDAAEYACVIQSLASSTIKRGPFFSLTVSNTQSFQDLQFAYGFPKAFPSTPIVGQPVRLECFAFGYPTPYYSWTRRGASLPRGSELSSFSRVLTIPQVKIEDQGEYTCRAHNERGSIESSVWLSIQAEPNFTIPLENKHMDYRGEVTWTCEAFGVPEVQYAWLKNGILLEKYALPTEYVDRYFIQDNVLKIVNLDPKMDGGMYQCRASNELKTKYSSAQLRVLSLRPSFKKHPLEPETYAADQGNVTIVCNPEAAPRPQFVWQHNRNKIQSDTRRTISERGDLIINRVSRDDEGMYTCIASNPSGTDESTGRLVVFTHPEFTTQLPEDVHVAVMSNYSFICEVQMNSDFDFAFVWYFNGVEIDDKFLSRRPEWEIEDGTLRITNVSLIDAGEYICTVKSHLGSISSSSKLIVNGTPEAVGSLDVSLIDKTLVIEWSDGGDNGNPIKMYSVFAKSEYEDAWICIARNVSSSSDNIFIKNHYVDRKAMQLTHGLNPYTSYTFYIRAANDLGYGPLSKPSPRLKTSAGRPSRAPSRVGGGGGKMGELTITWDPLPPAFINGPNVYYKIYWRRKDHDEEFQSRSLKKYGNVGKSIVQIADEYYYTQYDVKVQAINDEGEGPVSEVATIFSAEQIPFIPPQNVRASSYNSTSLNVTWDPVPNDREKIRGKLHGHRIKYWPSENQEEEATYYLSRTTRPWALIVGLQPDTNYWVKVMAYNGAGPGVESERFQERTYRKAPQSPPTSVLVSPVNPSTVKVTWRYNQQNTDEEAVIGYKVRVWETDMHMSTAREVIVGTAKLEAFVGDLSPGKSYNLRVLAYSIGGSGRMSAIWSFKMGTWS